MLAFKYSHLFQIKYFCLAHHFLFFRQETNLHDNTLKETVYKKNKLNFRIPGHFYNRSAYCVIPPSLKRPDKYVNNVAGYSEVAPTLLR